jgi:hypothetical protein
MLVFNMEYLSACSQHGLLHNQSVWDSIVSFFFCGVLTSLGIVVSNDLLWNAGVWWVSKEFSAALHGELDLCTVLFRV